MMQNNSKPSETLKPLARTHTRVYGYTVLAKPRNPQPLYIYINIYRGLRRVFRFCGVFARVFQISQPPPLY